MAQARIERYIAPVVVVAVERLWNDLPREISRILVLVAVVSVGQDVLQWSLLSIRYRAAKSCETCGKSEGGTHDDNNTIGTRKRSNNNARSFKYETRALRKRWNDTCRWLMNVWFEACRRCHWWGTRAHPANPVTLLGPWMVDALLKLLLHCEAYDGASVPYFFLSCRF